MQRFWLSTSFKMTQKRVGIITLHYVDNHGGVLLACGLQKAINSLGYAAEIIDYDPTQIPSRLGHLFQTTARRLTQVPSYFLSPRATWRRFASGSGRLPSLHPHKSVGRRAERFEDFRHRHVKVTARRWQSADQLKQSPPLFDAYVCGSDQIWNPFMCRPDNVPGYDAAYFLHFAPAAKRIAYAPSIAVPEIPVDLADEFVRLANGIGRLSCREEAGAETIARLCGRGVRWVADPVLLLRATVWQAVAGPVAPGRYLLCYFLGAGEGCRALAKRLATTHGLKVKMISTIPADIEALAAEDVGSIGPAEFLSLVMGAACVCTDSFHGTLFSIIFERPFFVLERPGSSGQECMASRIHSVLGRLGLSDRLRLAEDPSPPELAMDYNDARSKLDVYRAESLDYLREALASACLE
jgi:hypothetical protein